MDNSTEIKQSKAKTLKLFLMSVLFVAAAIWIMRTSDQYDPPKSTRMFIAGIAGIVFFGLAVIFSVFKLFDSRPGILFTSEGFVDHSSYAAGYLVKWSDVKEIKLKQIMNQKFISVLLNNPEDYIARTKGLKKLLSSNNYKSYQTPVHISPVSLEGGIESIHRMFLENWENYKRTITRM
jgi:hypothetical protein